MGHNNRAFATVVYHFRSSVHPVPYLTGPTNMRYDAVWRRTNPPLGRAICKTPADLGNRWDKERSGQSGRFFARWTAPGGDRGGRNRLDLGLGDRAEGAGAQGPCQPNVRRLLARWQPARSRVRAGRPNPEALGPSHRRGTRTDLVLLPDDGDSVFAGRAMAGHRRLLQDPQALVYSPTTRRPAAGRPVRADHLLLVLPRHLLPRQPIPRRHVGGQTQFHPC